jgi:GTP-binding protein
MHHVVIVGRPNVGKSTLFNRLCRKSLALVDNTPGLTRDWRSQEVRWGDLSFSLYDTAGLFGFEEEALLEQLEHQTESLMAKASVIVMVVNAKEGILPGDIDIARRLIPFEKPVVLVVNKVDTHALSAQAGTFYALGMGDPLPLSATQGQGLEDLYAALEETLGVDEREEAPEDIAAEDTLSDLETKRPLKIAIVGRPNAGKSTLINALLGENRLITGDKPGITRDAIRVPFSYKGRSLELIDTAGMRRRTKVQDPLEKMSVTDALRAVQLADVVVLVSDCQAPLEKQDLHIAEYAIQEGRNLVLALNKIDLQPDYDLDEMHYHVDVKLPQVKGVPLVVLSGLEKKGLGTLMKAIFKQDELWNKRFSTAQLNRWLEGATQRHAPPQSGPHRVRLKYVTQIKSRPPTLAFFVSNPKGVPDAYVRYLLNSFRETFRMPGVTIRIVWRKTHNPYAEEGAPKTRSPRTSQERKKRHG